MEHFAIGIHAPEAVFVRVCFFATYPGQIGFIYAFTSAMMKEFA